MGEIESLTCICCDKPFGIVTPSVEHVIPNALGGWIKTKKATCIKCNSASGRSVDANLVKQFHLLANGLDVIRDRGESPVSSFTDPITGTKYEMNAGGVPYRKPDVQIERIGETNRLHITAPTIEIATRLLRRSVPNKPHTLSPLVPVKQADETFTFEIGYSIDDQSLLRSAARIATCYARHVGIPVDGSDLTVRFARGEEVHRCPVGVPRREVVAIENLPEYPLYHGVFLGRECQQDKLLVYVVLFQYCEFVVEFASHYGGSVTPVGTLQNLVSGRLEHPQFTWLLGAKDASDCIRERKLNAQRMASRFESVRYYLAHRERLWLDRASSIAFSEYIQQRESGLSNADSCNRACAKANEVLSPYNLAFDTFEVRERAD